MQLEVGDKWASRSHLRRALPITAETLGAMPGDDRWRWTGDAIRADSAFTRPTARLLALPQATAGTSPRTRSGSPYR